MSYVMNDIRGWDVYNSDRGLVIQRDDELALLKDDPDAVRQACKDATEGDVYARTALICVCTQDYDGWERYMKKLRRRNKA